MKRYGFRNVKNQTEERGNGIMFLAVNIIMYITTDFIYDRLPSRNNYNGVTKILTINNNITAVIYCSMCE